jgi:hypothetical protein
MMRENPIGKMVLVERQFWAQALLATPTAGLVLSEDPEDDHYTTLAVASSMDEALDNHPVDYPGTYEDYVCALAQEAMQQIDSWGRDDELDRTCRQIAFYSALARYVLADTTGCPLPSVLVDSLLRRLVASNLQEVLEGLMKAPRDKALKAIRACEGVLAA